MSKEVLCIILLVVFFAIMIYVGFYSRKHATDVNGFVLGGRGVGPWLTAFAFGTSYFSAVIFVGYAGQFGWNFGLASTWAGLGNTFIGSLLAWNVLGRRTRIMTQHVDAKTMPDFFGKRFDSVPLKVTASVIVFIFLIPYTASLYNGLSSLFGLVFDIPYWLVILIMAVLTGFYVIFGGYMATAINDFIQGIIMLFGICSVIGAVLADNGGFQEATKALASVTGDAGWQGAYTAFLGPDPLALLFVVILTSLGTWGLPQMVGKFYAIKSEKDIHKGTVISTVFAIIVAGGCYFLGGFGRLYADKVTINTATGKPLFDTIVPTMLSTLPALVIAVVIVLVLSASMSTLSSLVLTSSSTFTLDVIKPASKKEMSEKKQVFVMRVFIVFFIFVSAVIAIFKDAHPEVTFIAQMMGVSWGALAGSFLAPFLYGLYWKGVTKASAFVCFIWGCAVAVIQLVITLGGVDVSGWGPVLGYIFKSSINSGVIAMVGGLILVPVVSLFTKKQEKKVIDDLFACYEEKVMTTRKEALEDE
ncbi:sodium:solute symporter family protein [Dorea formicigenerans]|uniref:Sodium:solute symporter n=1 Tax=Dorea formicigenerans TaxID=39486 RepID=A0A412MGM3_9FIRM|nr:sodium:solute symporter [Dorea formicigenerans]RGT11196.1 sodium:solute symporter [Dorea formicigenerans]RHE29825.1 sodium:solute symporter [Dorea formicigenerans]RHN17686.1 sodium:solute symporter [Dorea formicigenerans]